METLLSLQVCGGEQTRHTSPLNTQMFAHTKCVVFSAQLCSQVIKVESVNTSPSEQSVKVKHSLLSFRNVLPRVLSLDFTVEYIRL